MEKEIIDIIKDYKNRSNKDLIKAMDVLTSDFESTKTMVIQLTKKLDYIELTYNQLLKEYDGRK